MYTLDVTLDIIPQKLSIKCCKRLYIELMRELCRCTVQSMDLIIAMDEDDGLKAKKQVKELYFLFPNIWGANKSNLALLTVLHPVILKLDCAQTFSNPSSLRCHYCYSVTSAWCTGEGVTLSQYSSTRPTSVIT